jgi:hypothetical protein
MRLLAGVVLVDVPALLAEVPGPLRVVGPQVLLGDVFAFPLVWRGEVVEVAFRWAKGAGVAIPRPPPGIWYPGITDWLARVAAVTGGRVVLVDDEWCQLSVNDAAGMLADLETSDDYDLDDVVLTIGEHTIGGVGPDVFAFDVPAIDHTDAQPLTEDLDLTIRDVQLVRVERMDDDAIWMEVTGNDGSTTTINLSAKVGAIDHKVFEWPAKERRHGQG